MEATHPKASSASSRAVRGTLDRVGRTAAMPVLPHVARAALAAANQPDVDADQLGEIIRTDVGLTAGILRLANSVAYARRRHATTLRDGILTIGLRKTCDVLVAAGARQVFRAAGCHTAALWNHALAVGLAAEALAKATHSTDADAAFLAGLLHDIGRIVLLMTDAGAVDAVATATNARDRVALERSLYGMDHAAAGADLVEGWGLSPSQCLALRWHHEPTRATVTGPLTTLVNAADALSGAIGLGFGEMLPGPVDWNRLGLPPDAEQSCAEQVRERFAQYVEVLAA